ncbi:MULTISPECIES: DUF732 domain-containing protein [Streptosporangium]|uniref:DUF732 domain-containing protein n=1 Tax=Streptosporangium brasiliense TaxID=47480 RepID=A0ABT9RCC7_9ACTN|nr:DUF732 domain-containing protein [Streptosporangium brasiliense]MDP9866911.1 hypothetical protein [Streptosporangium brasiliense]
MIGVVIAVVGVLALLGGLVALLGRDEKPVASTSASVSAKPSSTAEAEPGEKPTTTSTDLPGGKNTSTDLPRGKDKENQTAFMATMRQRADLKDKSAADLIRLGRAVCKAMDGGQSLIDVAVSNADELGAETSGYVAGAAVVTLCPRHQDKIPS